MSRLSEGCLNRKVGPSRCLSYSITRFSLLGALRIALLIRFGFPTGYSTMLCGSGGILPSRSPAAGCGDPPTSASLFQECPRKAVPCMWWYKSFHLCNTVRGNFVQIHRNQHLEQIPFLKLDRDHLADTLGWLLDAFSCKAGRPSFFGISSP